MDIEQKNHREKQSSLQYRTPLVFRQPLWNREKEYEKLWWEHKILINAIGSDFWEKAIKAEHYVTDYNALKLACNISQIILNPSVTFAEEHKSVSLNTIYGLMAIDRVIYFFNKVPSTEGLSCFLKEMLQLQFAEADDKTLSLSLFGNHIVKLGGYYDEKNPKSTVEYFDQDALCEAIKVADSFAKQINYVRKYITENRIELAELQARYSASPLKINSDRFTFASDLRSFDLLRLIQFYFPEYSEPSTES